MVVLIELLPIARNEVHSLALNGCSDPHIDSRVCTAATAALWASLGIARYRPPGDASLCLVFPKQITYSLINMAQEWSFSTSSLSSDAALQCGKFWIYGLQGGFEIRDDGYLTAPNSENIFINNEHCVHIRTLKCTLPLHVGFCVPQCLQILYIVSACRTWVPCCMGVCYTYGKLFRHPSTHVTATGVFEAGQWCLHNLFLDMCIVHIPSNMCRLCNTMQLSWNIHTHIIQLCIWIYTRFVPICATMYS